MRKSLTTLFGLICSFLLVAGLVLPPAASAAAGALSIRTITFNVIGLDSNKTSTGPNEFPVGARICNTGGADLADVRASFVADGVSDYISVAGPSTLTFPSLAAGDCTDAYFTVRVARTADAWNTALPYHIAASADGAATVTTPLGRELYVEKLVSQNRNALLSIDGPTTVYVGRTYTYTLRTTTATAYDQLESFLNLSNVIFRIDRVQVTYELPTGATGASLYADACGFNVNPAAGRDYRSCAGPALYPGGVGGDVTTVYTVTVMSGGTTTATNLIYDYSGSSYHYNSDFGTGINSLSVTAVNPPDLALSLTGGGTFDAGTTGTLTVGIGNAAAPA
jgi:hypothetical protein